MEAGTNPFKDNEISYPSSEEMDAFIRSNIWKAFSELLRRRKLAIANDFFKAVDMNQVCRLQGEGVGIDYWERLPVMLTQELKKAERELKETENANPGI